jgi:hypothetical protein
MSCGDEGDERAILPIAVFDLVSLLTFSPLFRAPGYLPSDLRVSSVALHTRVLQGGNELCRIEGFDCGKAVSELKVSIEAKAGLVPALARLINPESHVELQDHLTLEEAGMPSEHALAEGVIQLYAQKLKKVVVAVELQIAPGEVTDSKLAVLCDRIRDDATDVLVLCGCRRVTNISLSTLSHLDISGCNLGPTSGFHLAGAIKDMGAISSVNFLMNRTSVHQAENLVSILKEHPTLKSLCGNKGDGTELDMSGKMSGAGDAMMLAAEIVGNRALSSLNLSNCNIVSTVKMAMPNQGMKEGDLIDGNPITFVYSTGNVDVRSYDGIKALVNAIPDMGALIKLDISKNYIGAEQKGGLQRICLASGIELDK